MMQLKNLSGSQKCKNLQFFTTIFLQFESHTLIFERSQNLKNKKLWKLKSH